MPMQSGMKASTSEMTFKQWMHLVDDRLNWRVNMTSRMLSDNHPWQAWYEAEVSTKDAATQALDNEFGVGHWQSGKVG